MRKGFFRAEHTKMPARAKGYSLSCASCGLYKDCRNPRMEPFGLNRKNIMVIGEAPGEVEDRTGKPFQGKTGMLLQRTFYENGLDLFDDCIVLNSVNCRPKDNTNPTNMQVDCCREVKVRKALEEYSPKAVVLVGAFALQSFLGDRWKRDFHGINTWRGFKIPDQTWRAWVYPIWHPSYIEHQEQPREMMTIWNQDIKQISDTYNNAFPIFKQPKIHYLDNLDILDSIVGGMASLDFETTGLKPHGPGHRIVSASVSPDADTAFVSLIPPTRRQRKPLIRFLQNNQVSKIGHNIKFEQSWSMYRLDTEIMNIAFDSMLAAHVLDNRPNITSLAFQAYLYLGIMEYDDEVSPFLKSVDSKDGNSLNRIEELLKTEQGRKYLLTYNAWDTIVQYRIAVEQIRIMNYDFLPF